MLFFFPIIYAISLFTVFLATSVDVEKVFNQGHLLLSHLRSRLSVQSTGALMCLGVWSQLGYVKDSDIEAVVSLPEVPVNEIEEALAVGWVTINLD